MFRRWLRFAAIGLTATLVHGGVLAALVEGADIAAIWATLCGFSIAFIVSYLGHYYITFQSRQPHRRALPGFALSASIGAGLNIAIFLIVMDGLGASYRVAFVCTIIIVPAITYALAKTLAFDGFSKLGRLD